VKRFLPPHYIMGNYGTVYNDLVRDDSLYAHNGGTITFSNTAIPPIKKQRQNDVDDMQNQVYIVYTVGIITMATLLVTALYIGRSI
jgi:hypothetical protein